METWPEQDEHQCPWKPGCALEQAPNRSTGMMIPAEPLAEPVQRECGQHGSLRSASCTAPLAAHTLQCIPSRLPFLESPVLTAVKTPSVLITAYPDRFHLPHQDLGRASSPATPKSRLCLNSGNKAYVLPQTKTTVFYQTFS